MGLNDVGKINKNMAFKGYEIASQAWKMMLKMGVETFVFIGVVQSVLCLLLTRIFASGGDMGLMLKWHYAKAARMFFANPGIDISGKVFSAREVLASSAMERIVSGVHWKMFLAFSLSCSIYLSVPFAIRYFKARGERATKDAHIRGMRLIEEKELVESLAKSGEAGSLSFGNIVLPKKYEGQHVFVGGTTGVGKSVVLTQHLDAILANGHRALIHDFKGEFLEGFYRPGQDYILNPLDVRGLKWTLFNDVKTKADIPGITGSLIPPSQGEDRFWSTAAQEVLTGVMFALWNAGKRTNADIWQAVTMSIEEIGELCKSVPEGAAGYTYIQDASGKQAASVIAMLMSYVSWLQYACDGDFSIDDWLEKGQGVIYLTGRPELETTLKPYVSLFVDLLGKKLLSMSDDRDRRIYFLLDEFGNLQKLPTFIRLLTAARSKGGVVLIGVQDLASLENKKAYSREEARTIFNNCATALILKLSDPDTAKAFSARIGEYEQWETAETHSMGSSDMRDGLTLARLKKKELVVLPSEIMGLPILSGYLMVPEHNPVKIAIEIKEANKRQKTHEAFVLRPDLVLPDAPGNPSVLVAQNIDFHGRLQEML